MDGGQDYTAGDGQDKPQYDNAMSVDQTPPCLTPPRPTPASPHTQYSPPFGAPSCPPSPLVDLSHTSSPLRQEPAQSANTPLSASTQTQKRKDCGNKHEGTAKRQRSDATSSAGGSGRLRSIAETFQALSNSPGYQRPSRLGPVEKSSVATSSSSASRAQPSDGNENTNSSTSTSDSLPLRVSHAVTLPSDAPPQPCKLL